jgi:lipopolysaccharide export system permease protein
VIFEQATAREFRQLALSIFVVLLAVLVAVTLVRVLDRAAGGTIDPGDVVVFMLLSASTSINQLLALTAFLAVLLSVSRASRDHEMTVWLATGLSLLDWFRPLARFLWPLLLASFVVAWVGAPWCARESDRLHNLSQRRDESLRAVSGRFRESSGGKRIFFVGEVSDDGDRVDEVFVVQREADKTTWLLARSGTLRTDAQGNRFLDLEQGRRFDLQWSAPEGRFEQARELGFEHYGLLVRPAAASARAVSLRASTGRELLLLNDAGSRGEILRRVGQSLGLVVLPVLAMGLAAVSPRSGRAYHLLQALLIYLIYSSLNTATESLVARGEWPFALGLLAVHGGALLLGVGLLAGRIRGAISGLQAR